MPACFVRQTYIVFTPLSSHHAAKHKSRRQQDFAVVVHHRPHQLIATLARQSVRAKLYRPQLLAHAYQQPTSDVQVHHQQPACTSTKPAQ